MKRADLIKLIEKLPKDADIAFGFYDGESRKTLTLLPSGATPIGIDGLTRIGLTHKGFSPYNS